MTSKLKQWLATASIKEREALAKNAQTTPGRLRQAAGQFSGKANMKAGPARKVELAAEKLRSKNPELPLLLRTDLCADCAKCEYAPKRPLKK